MVSPSVRYPFRRSAANISDAVFCVVASAFATSDWVVEELTPRSTIPFTNASSAAERSAIIFCA
jgi:hypothetical protein